MDRPKFNYSKLRGRIIEILGSQKAFAERLGISEGTLVSRLKSETSFTQPEILMAIQVLDIPLGDISVYFFTLEDRKIEQQGGEQDE